MHPQTDNSIPCYLLFIDSQDLEKLQSNVWSNEPIPARLEIDQVKYDIAISYRGAHIRPLPKKSFQIKFLQPDTYQGAREVHLNAEYQDPSLIRNKLSFDFFHSLGTLSPNAQHVLLKLNGEILGIYLQLESVDDLFLTKRGLPAGAIYYAINHNANFSLISPSDDDVKKSLESGYKRKCGSKWEDEHLNELIYKINTIPRAEFGKAITNYVNLDKYLRWLAGAVCTQNFDGFTHNYALYRNSQMGLFEMIPWDYDATWGRNINGKIMRCDYIPIDGFNTLTARILDVQDFRRNYRQLMEEILATIFTVQSLESQLNSLYELLRTYVLLDPYKQQAITEFDNEPEYILQFITNRNRYLHSRLSDLDHGA